MKLIAHRGGRRGAENSIDALIHAARLGADAVECDLRRTRDGVPVIFHDDTLFRLTGNPAAVSELGAGGNEGPSFRKRPRTSDV